MQLRALTEGQAAELAALRRRAYGPTDGAGLSDRDRARLRELEELDRPPAAADEEDPDPGREEPWSGRVGGTQAPSESAAGPVDGGDAPTEEAAAIPAETSAPRSRRAAWAFAGGAALGLAFGVGGALLVSALMKQGPDLVLRQTDEEWSPRWEDYLVAYEIDADTMQSHDPLADVLMVWTADGIYDDRCLLVGHRPSMRITVETCTARDRFPVFDLIVTTELHGVLDETYPVGTTLRLVETEEAVEVFILDGVEPGRVAGT